MPDEYQRYGRNKETSVDHSYINGGTYRRKFDKVTDDPHIARILYEKAKEMLFHRGGTKLEDMYWIDENTGDTIACVTDMQEEQRIVYPKSVRKKVQGRKDVITMHTHPFSFPPSIQDFNSAKDRGNKKILYSAMMVRSMCICPMRKCRKEYGKFMSESTSKWGTGNGRHRNWRWKK